MASTRNLPMCKYRYVLFVSYLGHRYKGSQRLVNRSDASSQETIQEALEWSMESFMRKERCRLTACSRTDKGVHALMNVYTLPVMDYEQLSTEKLKRQANHNLSRKQHDIVINEVLLFPIEFHPRRDAISREYIYRLAVHNQSKPVHDLLPLLPITELYKVTPVPCFSYERAVEALELFQGEHDFATFANDVKDNQDTKRHLDVTISHEHTLSSELGRFHPFTYYQIHFKSRAFLHNQIRRIVGTVLSYATYREIGLAEIETMINKPSHCFWDSTHRIAEPWGLYLSRINYNKSALEGSYKTSYDGDTQEKVLSYPPPLTTGEMSDDQDC